MTRALGCGVNTVTIYDRRGEQQMPALALGRAGAVTWGRKLNEISTGSVTIPADQCSPELDKIHTWAHSLVVHRQVGEQRAQRVWEGPIRRKRDTHDSIILEAKDVLGWTERRTIRGSRKLRGTPVKTELLWAVGEAYALDDPNVLAFLQSPGPDGDNIDRDLAAWSAKYAEDISNLAGLGGRFTVNGRAIILFSDEHTLGRTPLLTPENHLLANVEIIEDGDLLLTSVTSRDDNNRRATVGGVDPFYGLVEDVISPGPGKHRLVALTRYAQHLYDQSYPAPVQVDIPQGAQLRTDAPFPMESLVPGTQVPIQTTTATGRVLNMTAVLSSVDVTQTGDDDEQVTITLVPVSQGAIT